MRATLGRVIALLRSDRLRVAGSPETEDRRNAERYRLALWGVIATAGSRLAGVLLMVLTVHWAAPNLTAERFGLWATFSGLLMVSSFLDLGVGNALINRVAHVTAAGDPFQIKSVVMGGLAWLVIIGLGAAAVLSAASIVVPWETFLKLASERAGTEARDAALIFSILFGISIVANGSLKILMGQQRSHDANIIGAAAALLACPAVWVSIRLGCQVGIILLAGFGTQFLAVLVPLLMLLKRRGLLVVRSAWHSMLEQRRNLLSSGTLFFLLQTATLIGWGGDTLLLGGTTGTADVAAFAIVQRLYLFASQPVSILNAPLWAAYADAQAQGDHGFIRKTLRRSLLPSISIGTFLAVFLCLGGPAIVSLWTHNAVDIPRSLFVAFAVWVSFECGGIALGTYLNGTSVVREQVIVAICFCVTAVPAKLFAATRFGATGVVVATTITYGVVVVGAYATVFRRRILRPLAAPKLSSHPVGSGVT